MSREGESTSADQLTVNSAGCTLLVLGQTFTSYLATENGQNTPRKHFENNTRIENLSLIFWADLHEQ